MNLKITILFIISSLNIHAKNIDSVSTDSSIVSLIIEFGKTYEGLAYRYGGYSPSTGFDCSGLMYYIFKMGGFILPRSSSELYQEGKKINLKKVQKGDFIFFKTTSRASVSHVGIVSEVEDQKIKMLHVSSSQGVQLINLQSSEYWSSRFIGAKRIKFK